MTSSEQRTVVTVRISESMKSDLQRSADQKGGNLSAEILNRLTEYETLRRWFDDLLGDSAEVKIGVALAGLRRGAQAGIAGGDAVNASLWRAMVTARCAATLFETVANHVANEYAERAKPRLVEGWQQRIDAGEMASDFDLDEKADVISLELATVALTRGAELARHASISAGPAVWDICFDKNNPLRFDAATQSQGLMGFMERGGVPLPPSFLTPPQTEAERLSMVDRMKARGLIRDAVKARIATGEYPGMSEAEAEAALYEELRKDPGGFAFGLLAGGAGAPPSET